MKSDRASAENLCILDTESRVLPLARMLHYAKREALSLGLTETAATIDQALSALVFVPEAQSLSLDTRH